MRKTKFAVDLTEQERARLRTLIGHGAAPARLLTHAIEPAGFVMTRRPPRW